MFFFRNSLCEFYQLFSKCNKRYMSDTSTRVFEEIRIPVPWGHIAGKWWNPTNNRPILALHGWQDNCGTFDRLIPLLKPDIGVLAIDMPGHGLSSKIPSGMFYHNMNYVILIDQIANYFKWNKVSLLGHSLGAISNFVYTMIFPKKVDFLLNIDGLKPLQKLNNAPRMALGIQELLKYDKLVQSSEEPPSYTLDFLKKKLSESHSINYEYVDYILERNIAQSKSDSNKFYFKRDPRLKARLILNWPHSDLLEGASRVKTPILLIKFEGSGYYENKKNFDEMYEVLLKSSKNMELHFIEGPHHTHLNYPERISHLINNFIEKHDVENRSHGGLTK